ncbi:hypothetical protein [Streptomyces sp. bgisy034]
MSAAAIVPAPFTTELKPVHHKPGKGSRAFATFDAFVESRQSSIALGR